MAAPKDKKFRFSAEEGAEICADSKKDPAGRLTGGMKVHKPEKFPAGAGKKHKQKACRVCNKRGFRSETKIFLHRVQNSPLSR